MRLSDVKKRVEKFSSEKEEKEKDFIEGFCRWEEQKDGEVFFPINKPKTVDSIPPGYYSIQISRNRGFYLQKKKIHTDELIDLSSDEIKEVVDDVKSFWDLKSQYDRYNFIHKRGVLLYGPPGSGKSCIINLLIKDLVENRNGVLFSIEDPDTLKKYSDFISTIFRKIEPSRPVIAIIEDIDDLVSDRGYEKMVLNLLDGINQIENVAYIATTNYPEKLAKRVANRPGRFDKRIKVGYPKASVRKRFFESKFIGDDVKQFDLKKMVEVTNMFTLAHCKEFFAEIVIKGKDMDAVAEELRKLGELPSSYDDQSKRGSAGFHNDTEDYEDDIDDISWGEESLSREDIYSLKEAIAEDPYEIEDESEGDEDEAIDPEEDY